MTNHSNIEDIKCNRCGRPQSPDQFETDLKKHDMPTLTKSCQACRDKRKAKGNPAPGRRKRENPISVAGELDRIMNWPPPGKTT